MTTIDLHKVSKRYTERWILKNCTYSFESNYVYGLVGPNGAGKSTLIKLISGYLSPSKGHISYKVQKAKVDRDQIYQHVSIAAPYASFQKQMTIVEMTRFILSFKKLRNGYGLKQFLDILSLDVKDSVTLGSLSSGQFQRFCLATAILTESQILLLDEPGSFLDENAKIWFTELLEKNKDNRIVIIASNDMTDLDLTTRTLDIVDYK